MAKQKSKESATVKELPAGDIIVVTEMPSQADMLPGKLYVSKMDGKGQALIKIEDKVFSFKLL